VNSRLVHLCSSVHICMHFCDLPDNPAPRRGERKAKTSDSIFYINLIGGHVCLQRHISGTVMPTSQLSCNSHSTSPFFFTKLLPWSASFLTATHSFHIYFLYFRDFAAEYLSLANHTVKAIGHLFEKELSVSCDR